MNPALNAVVHNEASRIVGLLEHAAGYCDELVVVDQASTDGTGDLARDFGATVIDDVCHGHAEPSRGLAAHWTKNPRVLNLDADEIIDPAYVDALVALGPEVILGVFGRATFVDGVLVSDNPDWQYRYYARVRVQHSTEPHSRVVVAPEHRGAGTVFKTDDPWILHTKSQAEHDADHARYVALGAVP